MMKHSFKKTLLILSAMGVMMIPSPSMAATQDDLDLDLVSQQRVLEELKAHQANGDSKKRLKELENLIIKYSQKPNMTEADEEIILMLAEEFDALKAEMNRQNYLYDKISDNMDKISNAKSRLEAESARAERERRVIASSPSAANLVNPGPSKKVSYTQDAINAQGASTMVFAYSPTQLYKIYCRTNYLTDIEFKKGEKIKFVGGGDTSSWAVNSTEVDGVPHLYIKPLVDTSTTNLIVTTNKHSYQLLLNVSDWYNPMVKWSYEGEEYVENMLRSRIDEAEITTGLTSKSYDNLNFAYSTKTKGTNEIPDMIFDDGEKTVIKLKKNSKKTPTLFIKERGKNTISLVNYKLKDNCITLDRLIDEAELRYSDKEIVTIRRK